MQAWAITIFKCILHSVALRLSRIADIGDDGLTSNNICIASKVRVDRRTNFDDIQHLAGRGTKKF